MKIAVVITTYNRPDALAAVLRGYRAQRDQDFELLVADDGSTAPTAEVVRAFSAQTPFPVAHVWQPDEGFRAAAIRNKAVAATDAPYIVFTDGDCLPGAEFVGAHRRLAEPGWFLSGNRVLLSPDFTRAVIERNIALQSFTWPHWLRAYLRRDVNRLAPLIRLPDGAWRKRRRADWRGAKTCNLAVWRSDLQRVNGLDETYSGWGLEDSDLVIRLLHAGVQHKDARFAARVFHLWHRENDRGALAENQRRLDASLHSDRVRALIGLDRHERELA